MLFDGIGAYSGRLLRLSLFPDLGIVASTARKVHQVSKLLLIVFVTRDPSSQGVTISYLVKGLSGMAYVYFQARRRVVWEGASQTQAMLSTKFWNGIGGLKLREHNRTDQSRRKSSESMYPIPVSLSQAWSLFHNSPPRRKRKMVCGISSTGTVALLRTPLTPASNYR